jgi:5-methylcytosine-specific restriction enzyme subunit McrC
MPYLSDVANVNPSKICWDRLRLRRSTASYRMLIGTCRLVVEGMLLTTEKGERSLAAVLREEEYNLLFEHFVLGYYQEECKLAKAHAAGVMWALDDDVKDMLPAMRTDITLERGSRVLIIDTKWYGSTTGGMRGDKVHSQNL